MYAQVSEKALAKCETARIADKLDPPGDNCASDGAVQTAIGKAATKLGNVVAKACGGSDGICGGADDETAAALGWPTECPGLYITPDCLNAVGPGCQGIATCLECIDARAVTGLNLAARVLLVEDPPVDLALNACQRTLAKSLHAYATARSKILQKCWNGLLGGSAPPHPCPDGSAPADSAQAKAATAVGKAAAKMVASICKACGGQDGACGGSGDLAPAAIMLAGVDFCAQAPAASLTAFVYGLTCLADLPTDCVAAATVPSATAYPVACRFGGTCGDGTIYGGEGCDDGNTWSGDGCSSTCKVEDGYACSGEPSICTATCVTAADCPGGDSPCATRTCSGGFCGWSYAGPGPAPTQIPGDCQQIVCNGSGGAFAVTDDLDLPLDDGNQCTAAACSAGVPSQPPSPAGTPCTQGGGVACDGVGNCVAPEIVCNDGLDDDGDGSADCADPDCALACAIGMTCGTGETLRVYRSTDTPLPMPDPGMATSTITVGASGTIARVVMGMTVLHPFDADVDVLVLAPSANGAILTSDNGGGDDDYVDTVFDDFSATSVTAGTAPFTGSYRPETPLSAVNGEDINGAWALSAADDTAGSAGTLVRWGLAFCVF